MEGRTVKSLTCKKTYSYSILIFMIISLFTTLVFFTSWISPVRSSDLDLIFFDDFNDGVNDGWIENLGAWDVVNEEYFISVGTIENGISTVDEPSLTDCTIETKFRFTDTVGFRAGIVFRYIDNAHYYAFELSNEYDTLFFCEYLPENTAYGTQDAAWAASNGISVPTHLDFEIGQINTGVEYTLRVTINGNMFTGSLISDDVNATISWEDTSYTAGKVGLRARTADVYFDDFKVHANPTWFVLKSSFFPENCSRLDSSSLDSAAGTSRRD